MSPFESSFPKATAEPISSLGLGRPACRPDPIITGHGTIFNSASQIVDTAFNNANDSGTWTVTVVNPGSISSNTFSFTVTSAKPAITGVSPSPVPALNGAQYLTINGNTFQNGATVTYHDPQGNIYAGHGTIFNSTSQIVDTAFNNANDSGTWTMTVVNPGSISSNTFSFTVSSATPAITGVSPSPVPALNGTQYLTINGNTFQNGATVTYHDPQGNTYAGHGTIFNSASQLVDTAFNNANDSGTWTMTVVNPGGISSNTFSFTVSSATPAITGVSPSPVPALNGTQYLTINGNTFQNGATVTYHDPQGNTYAGHGTIFNSASQLVDTAFNNANDSGTWTMTVVNPGGISSNTFSFTVH